MALIDNTTELKKHNGSLSKSLEMSNLQSFIDDAITTKVVPVIGFSQFNDLVAKKAELGAKEYQVFDLLQKAVTGFMVANFSDNGSVQIDATGIFVMRSDKISPASDKKIMQLKKSNSKAAFAALEMAVNYLEDNISDFALYSASDEHKRNRSQLINKAIEFQDAGVQIRGDAQLYQILRVYQKNAEETYISTILGDELLELLYGKILSNTLNDAEKLLLKKVRKPLAYFTMVEAIPYQVVSIDASGVFELSETVGGISGNVENRNAASDKRLGVLMNKYLVSAEQEMEKLRKFLNANAQAYNYTNKDAVEINDGSAANVHFI